MLEHILAYIRVIFFVFSYILFESDLIHGPSSQQSLSVTCGVGPGPQSW